MIDIAYRIDNVDFDDNIIDWNLEEVNVFNEEDMMIALMAIATKLTFG